MKKIISASEHQTIEFGKNLASQIRGGEVFCLYGNLGAGKTTLIKGIAVGLGIKKSVTSPTFILMNVYKINLKSGLQNFIHIDCYRINSASEIANIGATEYFHQPDSVVVIEWPERIKEILPAKRWDIYIEIKNESQREIRINKI